jgi:hypothetical protein
MSWYTVDREVETALNGCQRQVDGAHHKAAAMRTLRFRTTASGQDVLIGAFGLCNDCADYARGGNLIAFSRSISQGDYVR